MLPIQTVQIYEIQRNAERLFSHKYPWSTWSCDLSFVREMREKDDVCETKCIQCHVRRKERGIAKIRTL